MRVLVTFGSERGGTAQIAEQVGATLRESGIAVDVLPAQAVRDARRYDAVLVGGALYTGRWHHDARRFVLRYAAALRERPVWFFSSGPLDDSATRGVIAPVPQVQQLMDYVGARGHATFGGRLEPNARGFIASQMARTRAGDWRDTAQISAWARAVAFRLQDEAAHPSARPARAAFKPLPSRARAVAQTLLAGSTAVVGGALLVARPDGSLMRLPLSVLSHSPFHSFLVPGLLLLAVVGLGNLWASALHVARSDAASFVSFVSGCALLVWTVVEMIMLRSANGLQLGCLLLGAAIVEDAVRRLRAMLPPPANGARPPAPSRA